MPLGIKLANTNRLLKDEQCLSLTVYSTANLHLEGGWKKIESVHKSLDFLFSAHRQKAWRVGGAGRPYHILVRYIMEQLLDQYLVAMPLKELQWPQVTEIHIMLGIKQTHTLSLGGIHRGVAADNSGEGKEASITHPNTELLAIAVLLELHMAI